MARPATRFIVGSNNSSHTVKIPFACSQPVGQYVEGVHQNPLICIRPRDPPLGSLALNANSVQFDSRFSTLIRVGVSVAGQPTLSARLTAPTQAVTGVVLEVVVVLGSVPSGIVAYTVDGVTLDMPSEGSEAPQRSTKDASPQITHPLTLIVK
jgi:hypothetical protein